MQEHNFSDDTPIEDILLNHLKLDIRDMSMQTALTMLTIRYVDVAKNLGATTALFTFPIVRRKYSYLFNRIFNKYNLTEEQKIVQKTFIDEFIFELSEQKTFLIIFGYKKAKEVKQEATQNANNNIENILNFTSRIRYTLIEYEEGDVHINSYAFFRGDELVVDYWRLNKRNEDEYTVTLKGKEVKKLAKTIGIDPKNTSGLLNYICEHFKEDHFLQDYRSFLAKKSIQFELFFSNDEN